MTLKRATTLKQRSELLQSVSSALSVVKPQPWQPHFYQKRFTRFLLENGCAAGWLDPGLGKTSCTLAAFKILKAEGMVERMLVIAPRRVCRLVWPAEIQKWTDFNGITTALLHGSKKDAALESDADVYLINPEGLPWLMQKGRLLKIGAEILCIDESSKFKHTNTQRFKLMRPILNRFQRRWTLTGTPSPNGYMDVFGQIYLTDMGAALGQYITHYRNNYFDATGFGGYTWELKKDAEKKIQQRLKPVVMRLDAKDYLKLPKETPISVFVELPADVRKVYDEMEEKMLTEIESEKVTAVSAAVATMKCCQIANGGLFKQGEMDKNGLTIRARREWANLHDEKTDAVVDIIEELGGKPVLIAYDFEHDLDRLLEKLGKDSPRMGVSATSGTRSLRACGTAMSFPTCWCIRPRSVTASTCRAAMPTTLSTIPSRGTTRTTTNSSAACCGRGTSRPSFVSTTSLLGTRLMR